MSKRIIALIICFCFIFEQAGVAQIAPQPVTPVYLSNLTPAADRFRPPQLRLIEFDAPTGNCRLLLDRGDLKQLDPRQAEESSRRLFEYFRIGLALPNSMFWVNLRPDSSDTIIDPCLEKTDIGRILLAADVQLKKDLARFTHPDTAEGRQYWNKLYAKAEELYGLQDIEIPTLTRPWIVPGEIILKETPAGIFIYKASLKVMLEQDYLKGSDACEYQAPGQKALNEYSSELIRDLIIPKLTRAVNSSKRYADLRQVYYSLILAQWFKQNTVIARSEAAKRSSFFPFDSRDLSGLTSRMPWSKHDYYQAYRTSYMQGEYRKEEQVNSSAGIMIRQFVSGGLFLDGGTAAAQSAVTIIRNNDPYAGENLKNAGAFFELAESDGTIRIRGTDPLLSNNAGRNKPASAGDGGTRRKSNRPQEENPKEIAIHLVNEVLTGEEVNRVRINLITALRALQNPSKLGGILPRKDIIAQALRDLKGQTNVLESIDPQRAAPLRPAFLDVANEYRTYSGSDMSNSVQKAANELITYLSTLPSDQYDKDGGSWQVEVGIVRAIDPQNPKSKSVRLYGKALPSGREPILASVFATGFDRREDKQRRLIYIRPAEADASQLIPQSEAIVRAVAAAITDTDDIVRKRLGLSPALAWEDIARDHFFIIENYLMVLGPDGKVQGEKIKAFSQLHEIIAREAGSGRSGGYRYKGSSQPRAVLIRELNAIKAKFAAKTIQGDYAMQRDGGKSGSISQPDGTPGLSVNSFLKKAQKEIFTLKLPGGTNTRDVEIRPVIENLKAAIFNNKDINGLIDRLTFKRTHELLPEAASAAIKQKLIELRKRGRAIKVLPRPASPDVQPRQEEYLLSRFKGAMDALNTEERTRVEEFLYYYGRMHEARTVRGNASEQYIILKAIQNDLPGITESYVRQVIERGYQDKSLDEIGPLVIEALARPEKFPGFSIADLYRCIQEWLGFGATDRVADLAIAAINRHPSRITEQDVRKWITACRRRGAYGHATEILIAAVRQGILAVTPNDVRQSEKDLFTKGLLAAVVAGQNIKGLGVDDVKTAMALHRNDKDSGASYEFRVAMAVIQNNTPGITPPDIRALLDRRVPPMIVDLPIALMDISKSALTGADIDMHVRRFMGFRNEEAARLAVAAIDKGVPGVTPDMIQAWVEWLVDQQDYVEAGEIAAAAAAQHIRGFDADFVNSLIHECFTQRRWDQFGYELLCTALEKHIPGIDAAVIHADIENSIRHGEIENAGTLAVTAATAIPRNEKMSVAITAGIELADADRLFFILPHTLLMDKAVNMPGEQFRRVQQALSRFRDTFTRINSGLARDRRFDADVFENRYMAIAFSLEMLLPGALDQVSGLLEKSRNPQVAIRLLAAKDEALLDRDMLEQLEALKGRLYKRKKVQASAFYDLIDIANAYLQSRAQQLFAREVNAVQEGESVEDVRKRLAQGLLAPLAAFAGISIQEVSPQAHKNIDFEFMDHIKLALGYISDNEPYYLDLFRGVLRAMLADRFWEFIEDESQADPVGGKIAGHNNTVRKKLNSQGIDDRRWLGKNKSDRMAHREFMYAFQTSKLEYDPVSDAHEVVRYLEMALNLGLPRPAVQPLADCLRSRGIVVTTETDEKGIVHYLIPKAVSKNKDVYALLAEEKLLIDIEKQADALLLLKDIRNTDWRLESVNHLKERVSVLSTRLQQDEYRDQLKGLRYHFLLRPIARNPGRDLFLGDYTSCCLAMNSDQYPEAMAYRLIDEGLNVIEVVDQATGRTIALSWLYIDEAGNLVIQNMEINAEYERIKPLMHTIGDEMISYAQEFSGHIGARGTLLGMPGHGKYFHDSDFMEKWGRQRVEFGREKIGGYLGNKKPYLDSAGKPYAFRVPDQKQRDGGETAGVKIVEEKMIEFVVPPDEVRSDADLTQKANDVFLALVDTLIAGTVLDGLAYVEPFTISLREFDKNKVGFKGDVARISETTIKTLIRKLAANSFDAFATFRDKEYWDDKKISDMPPIPGKGELTFSASWATHPNGKECLKITLSDNGAGEYAADTRRKWELLNRDHLYFGGYGLDHRMIRFGDSETGAPGLLAFLWGKAGVAVGKNERNEDNTDDFYQARNNEHGWGSTVTVWLPRECLVQRDGGQNPAPLTHKEAAPLLAGSALSVAREIHNAGYDTVVMSGGSNIITYTFIKAAWNKLFPDKTLTIHTLSQAENADLYQYDSMTIVKDMFDKINKMTPQEKPILYLDTHWDLGLKRHRLRDFNQASGGKDISFAVFASSIPAEGDIIGTMDMDVCSYLKNLAAGISETVAADAALSNMRLDESNIAQFENALGDSQRRALRVIVDEINGYPVADMRPSPSGDNATTSVLKDGGDEAVLYTVDGVLATDARSELDRLAEARAVTVESLGNELSAVRDGVRAGNPDGTFIVVIAGMISAGKTGVKEYLTRRLEAAGEQVYFIDSERFLIPEEERESGLSYPRSKFDVDEHNRVLAALKKGETVFVRFTDRNTRTHVTLSPGQRNSSGEKIVRGQRALIFITDNKIRDAVKKYQAKPQSRLWYDEQNGEVYEEIVPERDTFLVISDMALIEPYLEKRYDYSCFIWLPRVVRKKNFINAWANGEQYAGKIKNESDAAAYFDALANDDDVLLEGVPATDIVVNPGLGQDGSRAADEHAAEISGRQAIVQEYFDATGITSFPEEVKDLQAQAAMVLDQKHALIDEIIRLMEAQYGVPSQQKRRQFEKWMRIDLSAWTYTELLTVRDEYLNVRLQNGILDLALTNTPGMLADRLRSTVIPMLLLVPAIMIGGFAHAAPPADDVFADQHMQAMLIKETMPVDEQFPVPPMPDLMAWSLENESRPEATAPRPPFYQADDKTAYPSEDAFLAYRNYTAFRDYVATTWGAEPALARALVQLYIIDREAVKDLPSGNVTIQLVDTLPLPNPWAVGMTLPGVWVRGSDVYILKDVFISGSDGTRVGTTAHELGHVTSELQAYDQARQLGILKWALWYMINPADEETRVSKLEIATGGVYRQVADTKFSDNIMALAPEDLAYLSGKVNAYRETTYLAQTNNESYFSEADRLQYEGTTRGGLVMLIAGMGGLYAGIRMLKQRVLRFAGKLYREDEVADNLDRLRKTDILRDESERDGGSDNPGGIDFRALPGSGHGVSLLTPTATITQELQALARNSDMRDLSRCWEQIERQMRTQQMPYAKIKEFIAVCSQRPDGRQYLERTAADILNILRLEEEHALSTQNELKEILKYIG